MAIVSPRCRPATNCAEMNSAYKATQRGNGRRQESRVRMTYGTQDKILTIAGLHLVIKPHCGKTGKTKAEGCLASCRMVLAAFTIRIPLLCSSPVFKFRSKRGKFELEISSRN